MILRELHIDERKSAVACVDARDESVMGHIRFSSARLKDSCLNARGKSKAGNSAGNSQRFSKVSSLDSSNGGADGIRTHDLLDAIEARSQLRHGPTGGYFKSLSHPAGNLTASCASQYSEVGLRILLDEKQPRRYSEAPKSQATAQMERNWEEMQQIIRKPNKTSLTLATFKLAIISAALFSSLPLAAQQTGPLPPPPSYSGFKAVADLLNRLNADEAKKILDAIEEGQPELALSIRNLMFTFEDLITVPPVTIREIVSSIDKRQLALALRGANEDLRAQIFKAMSSRAVEILKQEMEVLGPVRSREVAQAQQEILDSARRLESEGKVILKLETGDAMIA